MFAMEGHHGAHANPPLKCLSTYAVMPMSPNIDDRPTCSKCSVEMLCGIAELIVPGYELRNFECPSCGDKLKLVGYAGPIKTMSKPE